MLKILFFIIGAISALVVLDQIPSSFVSNLVAAKTSVPQQNEITNEPLRQLDELTPDSASEVPSLVSQTVYQQEPVPETLPLQQFVFFSPFNSRIMADGMARTLSRLAGYHIQVLKENNTYRLFVEYASEDELQVIQSTLNAYVGA